MNKKLFVLLVILMSLSLIGIIFVQFYWIKQSVEDKEEQFSNAVTEVLNKVTNKIEVRERKNYTDRYLSDKDSIGQLVGANYTNIMFGYRDVDSNELRFRRRTSVFKEEYGLDGKQYALTPLEVIEKIGGLNSVQLAAYEDVFSEEAKRTPIHLRVSKQEIELRLNKELENRKIDINYEYGIYSNGLPTKVKSKGFKYKKNGHYEAPIFSDSEGKTNFSLLLSFPTKKQFLIDSIIGLAILSSLIIVASYSGAIYQLIRQKQIAEIKTDFINNMTHEFKTPIATINLAVEAIRNPKIIGDQEKVLRYLQMIRDENKRMHAQVENVLRISKLEKNQLDISKDRVDVHDIIADAIAHVELIVADRGGYIETSLIATRTDVLASEMHFTNVIVNILDNAVKYSTEAPKIDVSVKNSIIVKIQDQGAGMSKAVLKKVFEKFYREHTGNIHNVKGHGLGLAYVKKIVDDHQGEDYLSMNDFEVTLAKNGMEGFEKFKKDNYDICILDVMMPYKDGFTLAKEIREKNENVPIVFLTAEGLQSRCR
ncbi:Sensor protein RprX [Nymphon striatum]|nr:Sensor protein RprX [Nymphon striatum]